MGLDKTADDHKHMLHALTLAAKGAGRCSPNPMVGCVVVKNSKVIASGYHQKSGSDHAEINALKKIKYHAVGTTMYVTLEPCCHFGKTPPCVDAVIRSGIKRVVIAMQDPNPLTNGRSIKKLEAAGIKVSVGICGDQAKQLNRFFIKAITKKRPYVIVKVAQSLDGKISTHKGKQGWITGERAKGYVQDLRSKVDAVMVGRGTVKIDNPMLNVRDARRPQPKRVILDPQLTVSLESLLFKVPGGDVVLVCGLSTEHRRVLSFKKHGVVVLCVKKNQRGGLDLDDALLCLYKNGINSVLVEGGAKVFSSFARSNLVDEWQFIVAPRVVGSQGLGAFEGAGPVGFKVLGTGRLGDDILICASSR
ncbi:MAG: bifunctional diaminohydroxyphosphoribosylaminopyrimidine deaminase/5-amino-6-(5-phosphoribosylamino)uracil reductase RibD [Deltaproteobacteria bacterium]|nr:bifunctional diaminohydroxyphosphoribosylaminopyrimidine deaminase/5-amino-6-(5-phosphoribosylamino)uracil reductase RibD [Deltaproteobacteria bacterium]